MKATIYRLHTRGSGPLGSSTAKYNRRQGNLPPRAVQIGVRQPRLYTLAADGTPGEWLGDMTAGDYAARREVEINQSLLAAGHDDSSVRVTAHVEGPYSQSRRKPKNRRNPRTWSRSELAELSNLFHLAATALPPAQASSRYERRKWAAREYEKLYPEVSSTAAYKRLTRDDAWRYSNPAPRRRDIDLGGGYLLVPAGRKRWAAVALGPAARWYPDAVLVPSRAGGSGVGELRLDYRTLKQHGWPSREAAEAAVETHRATSAGPR